jgi:hypothetical protein
VDLLLVATVLGEQRKGSKILSLMLLLSYRGIRREQTNVVEPGTKYRNEKVIE